MDQVDRKILTLLQHDSSLSLNEMAQQVNLSRNACWNRVKQMEDRGIIRARVTLLDPDQLNLGLTVFISVRTNNHTSAWLERFHAAVRTLPEIIGIYRTTGEVDYLLQAVVPSMKAYDALYQRLISKIELNDVSSSFVMEELRRTTVLPLDYA
ncbi:MAG: Lrp/AsnC family transcriptional regulator [Anderseniella sp.]|jgi:Lrp/AsnC family transcriptional regulator